MVDTCNSRNPEARSETSLSGLSPKQIKWKSTDTKGQCIFIGCSWEYQMFQLEGVLDNVLKD